MDDLPPDKQQHVDDQTALANPQGPGTGKLGMLDRIRAMLRLQRDRRHDSAPRPRRPSE